MVENVSSGITPLSTRVRIAANTSWLFEAPGTLGFIACVAVLVDGDEFSTTVEAENNDEGERLFGGEGGVVFLNLRPV